MIRSPTGRVNARQNNFKKLNADSIKNSINALDFYCYELAHAQLKKHGWNSGGLCPFHADNTPGSFRVNTETGAFKCFACDTKGGDIIAFTIARYGLRFTEAIAKLSNEWGLS